MVVEVVNVDMTESLVYYTSVCACMCVYACVRVCMCVQLQETSFAKNTLPKVARESSNSVNGDDRSRRSVNDSYTIYIDRLITI